MNKILLYTENYVPGGGNKYLIDIVNALPPNCEIVIGSNINGLFEHDLRKIKRQFELKEIDIHHTHTEKGTFSGIKKLPFLIKKFVKFGIDKFYNRVLFNRLIDEIKPDLLICANGGYPAALTCLQMIERGYKRKIPTILTVVSMPQKLQLWERFFYHSSLTKVDKIIVNSRSIRDEFIKDRKVSPNKISILYNCIDSNSKFREKNDGKILTIGYVGRIEYAKGISYLIEAFAKLLKENANVQLLLVGSITEPEVFQEQINQHNLENKLILTDFYDGDIQDMLNKIDIFSFPSLWEGFPYSILEAMAAGCVIVATNVGGIPEAINNEVNGILVNPGNAEELYCALKRITADFDKYSILGETAIKDVKRRFVWNKFETNLHHIIMK